MITTDASTRDQTGADGLFESSLAPCRLRLVDDASRSAPIGADPVTVGAGPRSDLRIEGAGVKPLACVVSRRGAEIFARRWSSDVLLNDAEFTEATIEPGDRLTIGSVVLELYAERIGPDGDRLPENERAESPEREAPAAADPEPVEPARDADPYGADQEALGWSSRELEADDSQEEQASDADDLGSTDESSPEPAEEQGLWDIERDSVVPGWPEDDEASPHHLGVDEASEEFTNESAADSVSATDDTKLRRRLEGNRVRVRRLVASFRELRADAERQASAAAEAIERLGANLTDTELRCTELTTGNDELREELAGAVARIAALESEARTAAEASDAPAPSEDLEAVEAVEADSESFFPGQDSPEAFEETPESSVADAGASPWGVETLEESSEPQADPVGHEQEAAHVAESPADLWEQDSEDEFTAEPTSSEEALGGGAEELRDAVEQPRLDAVEPTETPGEGVWAIESQAAEPPAESAPESDAGSASAAPALAESFYERYAHLLPEDDEETPDSTPPAAPLFGAESVGSDSEDEDTSIDDYLQKMMERIRGDGGPETAVGLAGAAPVEASVEASASAEEAVALEEPILGRPSNPLIDLDEMGSREAPETDADMGSLRQLANQSARKAFVTADVNQTKEQAQRQVIIAVFAFCCGLLAIFTAPTFVDWRMLVGLAGVVIGGFLGYQTFRDLQVAIRNEAFERNASAESGDDS